MHVHMHTRLNNPHHVNRVHLASRSFECVNTLHLARISYTLSPYIYSLAALFVDLGVRPQPARDTTNGEMQLHGRRRLPSEQAPSEVLTSSNV